jgi:hypothetical protein
MSDSKHNLPPDETEEPNDVRLTELVAYLDGELEDYESDRLERQLVSDAPLRSYADSLDRTWRLLDSLGETTASGEFTQRTLASIDAVPLDDDDARQTRASSPLVRLFFSVPWLKTGLWCFIGFISVTAGLLFSRSGSSPRAESSDTQLLRQLDLLQDYPKMRLIPDVEFLQKVAESAAGSSDPAGAVP